MKDKTVKLILDTSAVLAYARGSIDVGETIAEVVDEGDSFGASVISFAEASRRARNTESDGVALIAAHGRFRALGAPSVDWQRLAAWTISLGDIQLAAASIEAIDRDGYLMTSEPDSYTSIDGGENLPLISF